jgi:hypothetical protein
MNSEKNEVEVVAQNQLVITKSFIGQADDLALDHESFNERYIVAGRLALYDLLAKIYELAENLDKLIDKESQLDLMRKNLFTKYGIRTQENTSDLAVLVRYITHAERKNAHVYTKAIETARQLKIKPENFVEFIQDNGGIERVRGLESNSDQIDLSKELDEEKVELTWKLLGARSEIPLASFDAPKEFKNIYNKNCSLEFVICVQDCHQQYHVVGKLPAVTELETYLVKYLSKYLCEDVDVARQGINKFVIEAEKKRAVREAVDQAKREMRKEMAAADNS